MVTTRSISSITQAPLGTARTSFPPCSHTHRLLFRVLPSTKRYLSGRRNLDLTFSQFFRESVVSLSEDHSFTQIYLFRLLSFLQTSVISLGCRGLQIADSRVSCRTTRAIIHSPHRKLASRPCFFRSCSARCSSQRSPARSIRW
jgi:hypothetical protein